MQFWVIVVTARPTHTSTHPHTHEETGPITIHCAAASMQCNKTNLQQSACKSESAYFASSILYIYFCVITNSAAEINLQDQDFSFKTKTETEILSLKTQTKNTTPKFKTRTLKIVSRAETRTWVSTTPSLTVLNVLCYYTILHFQEVLKLHLVDKKKPRFLL